MTAFLWYVGILVAVQVLLRLPLVGHGVQHLIQHVFDHLIGHDIQRAVMVFAVFVWALLIGLLVTLCFGFWLLALADLATLACIYAFCNRSH